MYYKILPILIAGFFGMMLFGTVVSTQIISRPAWLSLHVAQLFSALCYAVLILFVWSFIKSKIKKNKFGQNQEKRFLIIFFAILFAIQVGFASQMSVPMNLQCIIGNVENGICVWDFNALAEGATKSVDAEVDAGAIDYLHRHQNNIPTFYLLRTSFQVAASFGVTNFQAVGILLNIVAINASVLFIYLIARRFFGVKKAIFALIFASFVLPLVLLYVPIFYTDTLSLPFPIAIIYFYLKLRDEKRFSKKSFGLLATIAGLAFFGSMIKFSVMIAVVAIFIDTLIRMNKSTLKQSLLTIGSIIIMLAPMFAGYNLLANKYIHSRSPDESIVTPWTHYVMMGMGKNGGQYDLEDDRNTSSYTSQSAAVAYNIEQIKKRLGDHGLTYIYFLYNKAVGTWSGGDFESTYRLNNTGIVTSDFKPSPLQEFIVSGSSRPFSFRSFLQAMGILLILGMAIGAIRNYGKKQQLLSLLQLSVFGLAIFLLIWETNSRYVVNFLPLITLLSAMTWWDLSDVVTNKIKIGYLTARKKVLKY